MFIATYRKAYLVELFIDMHKDASGHTHASLYAPRVLNVTKESRALGHIVKILAFEPILLVICHVFNISSISDYI